MGMNFKQELQSKGAREFHIVALSADEPRALAAIAEAERRGVDSVIPYAMTLYEDPSWSPTGAKSRVLTNQVVEKECEVCGRDRFIEVTNDPSKLYGETYKPCPICNASVDAGFWKPNGERFVVAR
jgi:hypothetical protein